MKVKELYDAVALLGFETDIDEEATFFPALNTALHDVLRLVPQKKRAFLAHYPPTALATVSDKLLYSGGVLSYQAEEARAFYIEVSGEGEIIFTNSLGNAVTPKTTWDNPYGYRVIRCFLDSDIKSITIKAITMCKVRRMALYGELSSSENADIPEPSEYISYDLGRVFDDFGKLYEQPKITEDGEKKTLSDYTVDGNVLSLPRDAAGDIEIVYTPAIPRYTADSKDDICVPDDCIGALKLLVASYVWLDDNASRAQYYKSLYNEEIALIAAKHRDLNPVKYESVNNW